MSAFRRIGPRSAAVATLLLSTAGIVALWLPWWSDFVPFARTSNAWREWVRPALLVLALGTLAPFAARLAAPGPGANAELGAVTRVIALVPAVLVGTLFVAAPAGLAGNEVRRVGMWVCAASVVAAAASAQVIARRHQQPDQGMARDGRARPLLFVVLGIEVAIFVIAPAFRGADAVSSSINAWWGNDPPAGISARCHFAPSTSLVLLRYRYDCIPTNCDRQQVRSLRWR